MQALGLLLKSGPASAVAFAYLVAHYKLHIAITPHAHSVNYVGTLQSAIIHLYLIQTEGILFSVHQQARIGNNARANKQE